MVEQTRCTWCEGDELYTQYHDEEWGVPVFDNGELFERLVLEGMQAGLSWITVLRKRQAMQSQFFAFDMAKLADANEDDMQRWLQDSDLIRHRGKLQAMVSNAQLSFAHPDFSGWLWSFAPAKTKTYRTMKSVPSQTDESVAMSKALKKAGYKFVGPTICYALMQSVGMVNDHIRSCCRHTPCQQLRRVPPEYSS